MTDELKPSAYRVRDFCGEWIIVDANSTKSLEHYKQNGHYMEPLYPTPAQQTAVLWQKKP